jgi:hypothetical protein
MEMKYVHHSILIIKYRKEISMKIHLYRLAAVVMLLTTIMGISIAGDIVSAGKKGVWSSDTTWVGGVVPGPGDNVTIVDRDTVYLDTTTSIANLTVGQGDSASFRSSPIKLAKLIIDGDLIVNSNSELRVSTRDNTAIPAPPINLVDTIAIYGNLVINGNVDLRRGTGGSTLAAINLVFVGSSNSTLSAPGVYTKDTREFNGITINKTDGANVILGSNIYVAGGNSAYPALEPVVNFIHGNIVTGDYAFITIGTSSAYITNASDTTGYVVGALGRGLSNSSASSKTWPVGDEHGYRPFKVGSAISGVATGHHVIVRTVHANANTGSSSLVGGIDKVSEVRYYAITYGAVIGSTAMPPDSMKLWIFSPNYGLDDGIRTGNSNLRVAYSTDDRATWTKIAMQDSHSTNLNVLPRQINPDTLIPALRVDTSAASVIYIALADTAGSNPLDGTVPGFSKSPAALDFGNVMLGTWSMDSITVSNTGTGDLTLRSLSRRDTAYRITPSVPLTIPVGGSQKFYITFTPDTLGPIDGTMIFYHDAPHNPDTLVIAGAGMSQLTLNIPLAARWNMISLPITVLNTEKTVLYPSAISDAFAFGVGGYQAVTNFDYGIGYWLKLDTAESFSFTGIPISRDTIPLIQNWNLIGSLTDTIPVESIVAEGTTIQSSYFKYDNGYQSVTEIVPGNGYWIKVSQAGNLIMSNTTRAAKQNHAQQALDKFNKLIITDAAGNHQSLYFGEEVNGNSGLFASLPPAPPSGIFDARFASQQFIEVTDGHKALKAPITISSAVYPVTIAWEIKNTAIASLAIDNREIRMTVDGKTVMTSPVESIILKSFSSPMVPAVYSLNQNYPNPFNPVTSISFELPQHSIVTLKVYNLLGKEIALLVDRQSFEAGIHDVRFDASGFASGVYFYRIVVERLNDNSRTIESFQSIKKMSLIK